MRCCLAQEIAVRDESSGAKAGILSLHHGEISLLRWLTSEPLLCALEQTFRHRDVYGWMHFILQAIWPHAYWKQQQTETEKFDLKFLHNILKQLWGSAMVTLSNSMFAVEQM